MKKRLIVTSLMSLAFAQSVELAEDHYLQYKGELGLKGWFYTSEADYSNQENYVGYLNTSFDLTYQTPWQVDLRLKPRIWIDPSDLDGDLIDDQWIGENRSRAYFEDFYLDAYGDNVEFRVGWQTHSYKTVESLSWADFINQTDGQIDFFDAPKMGELAARIRYILPTESEQTLELMYLPWFNPTRYPQGLSRYNFFADKSAGVPDIVNRREDLFFENGSQWEPQFFGRYATILFESFDVSLFGFHGYDRRPVLEYTLRGPVPSYYLATLGGLTWQGSVEDWLLKGEVALQKFDQDSIQNGFVKIETELTMGLTTGFEYTLYSPLIENHDLGLILEGMYHTESGKSQVEMLQFIPFRNHIFTGLRYVFNNESDRSLLLGGFASVREVEWVLRLEYEERVMEMFKLRVALFGLLGEAGSDLENFESTTRAEAEFAWNF